MYFIDPEKCRNCKMCMRICPNKAIQLFDGQVGIDNSKCTSCSVCADFCSVSAIILCE